MSKQELLQALYYWREIKAGSWSHYAQQIAKKNEQVVLAQLKSLGVKYL